MKKTLVVSLLFVSSLLLISCSDKTSITTDKKSTSSSKSATATSTYSPLALTSESVYSSPFITNGETLFFSNWDDNHRISTINKPLPSKIINTSSVTDFADYSTDSLALINNTIYFSNGNNGNHLSSLDMSTRNCTELRDKNVHNLTASGNKLFYLGILSSNKNQNKLYSLDTITNETTLITSNSVGKYLINGDYILYQNLSDGCKLYAVSTDGSKDTKLSDFSVDSFATFENQILVINSSDNNNLYVIDPYDLKSKRLALINGHTLKVFKDKFYFINNSDSNYLYTLNVNLETSEVNMKALVKDSINDYYPTDDGVFYRKSININNAYIAPLA